MSINTQTPEFPTKRVERTKGHGGNRRRPRPHRKALTQRRITEGSIDYGMNERQDFRRATHDAGRKFREMMTSCALTLLPRDSFGLVRKVAELIIQAFRERLPPKGRRSRIRRAECKMRERLTADELTRELDILCGIQQARRALDNAYKKLTAPREPSTT